jgi:hypothetical protein
MPSMSSRAPAPGSARARRSSALGAILALACAAQPASSSPLLSSALALGLAVHGHAHAVSMIFDDGHLDLVLSHSHADPAAENAEGRGPAVSDAGHHDHVVHVAAGGSAHPRRDVPLRATLVGHCETMLPLRPASSWREDSAPRAPIVGVRSRVVLRL